MLRILYLRNEGEVPEQEGKKTRWIRQDYLEELIRHHYFNIEHDVWYECYALGGYVVFVKGCQARN